MNTSILASIVSVLTRHHARAARASLLAVLALLMLPGGGMCFTVSHSTSGDLDELMLSFDSPGQTRYSVRRVGTEQVFVRVQGESLDAAVNVSGGNQVVGVISTQDGALIETSTSSFGYIVSPVPGSAQVRIQVFPDPIGSRWKPRPNAPPDELNTVATTPTQQASPPAAPAAAGANQGEPLGAPQPTGPSLFAVPYSVRVHVNGGQDREIRVEPGEVIEYDDSIGSVRIKAVDGGPREVSVAPPPALMQERENTFLREVRDDVPGMPPEQPAPGTETTLPAEGQGVQGPLMSLDGSTPAPQADPVEQRPQEAIDLEAPPVEPAPDSFYARVTRSVTGTPDPAAQQQPGTADEQLADVGQAGGEQLMNIPEVGDAALQGALEDIQDGDTAPPEQEDVVQDDADAEETARQARFEGKTEEEIKIIEGLELQLLKAQSLVASGQLEEARKAFENLLLEPLLPQDLRVETLYSLGGVLMTLNKDTPDKNFNRIVSLYQEAMNADLKSPNIPTALMSLGLINLWAGNLPEAKAYFDILSSEHPYDENVPAIGYYYGEYYYSKGEYEKAADLFQQFIEQYPERERLARQSAMMLARALVEMALFEQAFQIVDYIDKRWPQAYEETPSFLKLAGDVEHRLGKTQAAKSHYWTYYNMNPKAEEADVVLARLGDLYLDLDEPGAAKELYERAVRDYPDLDGGLIAKMRLAEEGIYDEPTFMEMVTVFDKPYSLKPKQVYTEIIDEHPDSKLAPLALLKLGMWHFFQKEYDEALAAAQRMFTDYPRSSLVDRAKALGDRSFALAVPQLLERENYQLIVDYWERYDFASMSEGDDASATRIGVAKSYAELDEYEKALQLLKPFLKDEQVDTYSEMALAVAADVYLKQHAWNKIQELASMAEQNWDISDRTRRLMLHAQAVAMENLGDTEKAVRLWAQLGADEDVEPFIRADAMYHLAKEAMNHQDLRRVFVYAQEALSQLLLVDGDPEKIKDCLRMSIYATERSGRYQQALKWAKEYDKYVPEDDPEWAASRYRLARIYRKSGAAEQWREILESIRDKRPDTLYGRLAATAIETDTLEERAQEYAPIPN